MLVRIKDEDRLVKSKPSLVTNRFKNFFISYAKATNKAFGRTGTLFQRPFGRCEVTSDEYFARLAHYIHFNPQRHGLVNDFRMYPYSSYALIILGEPRIVERDKVLDWFGGAKAFIEYHNKMTDEQTIAGLIDEDD